MEYCDGCGEAFELEDLIDREGSLYCYECDKDWEFEEE